MTSTPIPPSEDKPKHLIRYLVEFGQFDNPGDLLTKAHGLTDMIVIGSVLLQPDGSTSTLLLSSDGRTKRPMDGIDLWKFWVVMAHELANDPDLDASRKAMCQEIFDRVRAAILAARSEQN